MKQFTTSLTIISTAVAVALGSVSFVQAASPGGQPAMREALAHAQEARVLLNVRASADKGGHRVAAIRALDQAIAQIKAGMAYDTAVDNPHKEGRRGR